MESIEKEIYTNIFPERLRLSQSQTTPQTDAPPPEYVRIVSETGACKDCAQQNGRRIRLADGVIGKTLPPFHPNCKCQTEPKFFPTLEQLFSNRNFTQNRRVEILKEQYGELKPYPNDYLVMLLNAIDKNENITSPQQKLDTLFIARHISDGSFSKKPFSDQEQKETIEEWLRVLTGFGSKVIRKFSSFESDKNAIDPMKSTDGKVSGRIMDLPEGVPGTIKRYEDYRVLTAWNQKKMQDMAYTDELGFRRIDVEGLDEPAYMAALGTFYTGGDSKGVVFRVELSNRFSFYLVAGDTKADEDTNETNQYTVLGGGVTKDNTDIIELIMDTSNPVASELIRYGVLNFINAYSFMDAAVIKIEKMDITVLRE